MFAGLSEKRGRKENQGRVSWLEDILLGFVNRPSCRDDIGGFCLRPSCRDDIVGCSGVAAWRGWDNDFAGTPRGP